jgi:hypothetical protein
LIGVFLATFFTSCFATFFATFFTSCFATFFATFFLVGIGAGLSGGTI